MMKQNKKKDQKIPSTYFLFLNNVFSNFWQLKIYTKQLKIKFITIKNKSV